MVFRPKLIGYRQEPTRGVGKMYRWLAQLQKLVENEQIKCNNGRQAPTRPAYRVFVPAYRACLFFLIFLESVSQNQPFHEIST